MQFFVELAKALGTGVLLLLSIPIFFLLLIFLPEFCTKRIDNTSLIHSQAFQHLHQLVYQLDNTKDIVVLPRNEYIVIDKLAIDLAKRTFGRGQVRVQGIDESYKLASWHKFSSLDSLLAPQHLDSTTVYQIIKAMKTTNVESIEITYKVIAYRWKPTSWRYSEEGILYVEDDMVNRSQYKLFEAIGPNFYHYARLPD